MDGLNRKGTRVKGLGGKLFLYARIMTVNAAVAALLFTVNIQTPPPAPAPVRVPAAAHIATRPAPPITGTPKRLVIPSLKMDLAVGAGSFNQETREWKIDTTKAYYADASVPVNNSNGTTLIYGHAQTPVFARLFDLKEGAKLAVHTADGYVFHYAYHKMTEVVPTDTSVFAIDGPPTVVLMTCTGPWDAYRAQFSFQFKSVEKT